jgi:hypothetical protein
VCVCVHLSSFIFEDATRWPRFIPSRLRPAP